jgi:hypothetical protein
MRWLLVLRTVVPHCSRHRRAVRPRTRPCGSCSLRFSRPRDLQPMGRRIFITLAGRQAERRDLLGPSAVVDGGRQLRERVRLVALPYRNGEYLYLLFVAPDEDFAGLQATFNRMMNSLQLR